MEKLQGPIHPSFLEQLEVVGCLEEENGELGMGMSYGQLVSCFEEPHYTLPYSLEDKMPFLQMLQSFEPHNNNNYQDQTFFPLMQEPNFQFLLKLQHQQEMMTMKPFFELESCCVTNNVMMTQLLEEEERREKLDQIQINSTTMGTNDVDNNVIITTPKGRLSKRSQSLAKLSSSSVINPNPTTKEKRKRKRSSRPSKNKEEVESQRMTHIAVERNRRRQMNDHLNALRSLMPPSYVQRGDQASIVGGAIDFVKELEQLLESLQAQKRIKQSEDKCDVVSATSSTTTTTSSSSNLLDNIFMSPSSLHDLIRYPHSHSNDKPENGNGNNYITKGRNNEEFSAVKRSSLADIEVVIIQNHVNLKIQCQRRPGQLLKAIVALEQLRLSVLHLNITSLHTFVHYSFNLKIEEDCKLGSADEVANAVHQIFRLISIS